MARALGRGFDHLPRCTTFLGPEKGTSLAHCILLSKKKPCKSVHALKRSITKDEAAEVVSVRQVVAVLAVCLDQ